MMKVIIYTTPTCVYCKATKEFFRQHNVAYQEIDVAADQLAIETLIQKTGQLGVPVISIEKDGQEELVVGFDQPRLTALLGIK